MMTAEELLIHELAERAGVSVRTIRYYIEEGLLPQPNYEGKYSYYSPSFLDRLELIRRLKDSYLPLREIREILNSLTDSEVRQRLKMLSQPSPGLSEQLKAPQGRAKPGARALDYIDHVMDNQSKYRTKGTQEKPRPPFAQEPNIFFQEAMNQPAQSSAPRAQETWQRISLAPGVEIHLRKPVDPRTEHRLQQLLNFARKIFHTTDQEGSNER